MLYEYVMSMELIQMEFLGLSAFVFPQATWKSLSDCVIPLTGSLS